MPRQSWGKRRGAQPLRQGHLAACQGVHGFLHTPPWCSKLQAEGHEDDSLCARGCLLAAAPRIEGTAQRLPMLIIQHTMHAFGKHWALHAEVLILWLQGVVGRPWLAARHPPSRSLPPPPEQGRGYVDGLGQSVMGPVQWQVFFSVAFLSFSPQTNQSLPSLN